MKSIEESVVTAMDGSDNELFPFLPYILQDLWEIGADPDTIVSLIKKYSANYTDLNVLDLGCGKGAVSVKISKVLGSKCYGVDAVPEFIEYAKLKALEFQVDHLCTFETGDIREKIKVLSGYDVVILGSIGPVFGDYYQTLTALSGCIKSEGIFIVDDGYIDDESGFTHPLMLKKSAVLQQIEKAGMELIEEDIIERGRIKESDDFIFNNLERRCIELIKLHPDKKRLFENYIKKQQEENDVLENKAVCSTMAVKKK